MLHAILHKRVSPAFSFQNKTQLQSAQWMPFLENLEQVESPSPNLAVGDALRTVA